MACSRPDPLQVLEPLWRAAQCRCQQNSPRLSQARRCQPHPDKRGTKEQDGPPPPKNGRPALTTRLDRLLSPLPCPTCRTPFTEQLRGPTETRKEDRHRPQGPHRGIAMPGAGPRFLPAGPRFPAPIGRLRPPRDAPIGVLPSGSIRVHLAAIKTAHPPPASRSTCANPISP